MRIYIPSKYIIQQKVLNRAYESKVDEFGKTNWPKIDELAKLIGCNESEIIKAANFLEEKEYAHHDTKSNEIFCRPKGKLALFQESILDEGWEKSKSNLLRWVQIFGIIIASLIAISTFIWNAKATNKNKEDLTILKIEVQSLKQKAISFQDSLHVLKKNLHGQNSQKKKP